ncbi:MAG: hypothetical protein K2L45_09610 [Muribaculaceae bacterium]|nr:hypothetical protein [Muribaculaceae bacterium]
MMKKVLNISLVISLGIGFAACVDSEDLPEFDSKQYISFVAPQLTFESGVGSFTRAELVDDVTKFTVWGYCIPRNLGNQENINMAWEPWEKKAKNFRAGADVLNEYVVNVVGDNTFYDVNNPSGTTNVLNPQKWYNGTEHAKADDYNYAFIAAATPSGNFTMSHSGVVNNSYPVLTFEMPHSSTDINTILDYNSQPDALIGTKFDQFNNSKVKLEFSHIMTGLRFRFHNECTATETDRKDLVIHRVTFSGEFYKKATFSFESENMRSAIVTETKKVNGIDTEQPVTYSGTFVLLDKDQTISAGESDLMRHDGDPKGRSVKFLLLPNPNATLEPSEHAVDDWALGRQKQIVIEYSINGGDHHFFRTAKDFQLKYIPDVNTLHTANFHFVGDDFIITFQADNDSQWNNGSDGKLEIH